MNFAAVWFDPGNAYGSDPHKLTESARDMYHILEKVQEIVKSCLRGKSSERGGQRIKNLSYSVCNTYVNIRQDCRNRDKRVKNGLRDLQHQSEASRITSQCH